MIRVPNIHELLFWSIFLLNGALLFATNAHAVNATISASRTDCVSPCTIVFSALKTTDASTPLDHEVFRDIAYHFTFDDPSSGTHGTTGASQQNQVGGPLATHTFICNAGTCQYGVGVRAQNSNGNFDDDFITVNVKSVTTAYNAANTICISTTGAYGGDKPCPTGAVRRTIMPSTSEFSGKRVLFRRGEVFGGEMCIGYDEKNVWIGSFGNTSEGKPELTGTIHAGIDSACRNPVEISTAQAIALGSRWAENITISDLRVPEVVMGMTFYNVGLHDLDMDYFSQSSGGHVVMATGGSRCTKTTSLDCDAVPYPYGLYMSELTVVGSDTDTPGVTIVGYNCPMINWLGMIGSTVWNAVQHQVRLEGGQRLSFSHNNIRGYTTGSSGKHTLTLRSCGYGDIDIAQRGSRHNAVQGTIDAPWSRWAVFADNTHGSPGATNPAFKLHIAPTNATASETIVDAVVERTTFITGAESSNDLALNGYYLTARTNNTYTPERQNCKDTGPGGNPVHGNIQCAAPVLATPLPPVQVSNPEPDPAPDQSFCVPITNAAAKVALVCL